MSNIKRIIGTAGASVALALGMSVSASAAATSTNNCSSTLIALTACLSSATDNSRTNTVSGNNSAIIRNRTAQSNSNGTAQIGVSAANNISPQLNILALGNTNTSSSTSSVNQTTNTTQSNTNTFRFGN